MSRTSIEVTQAELDAFAQYANQHHLELEGETGAQNGREIRAFMVDQWREEINERTLAIAFERLKAAGRLVFKSEAKAKFDQASQGMTQQEYNLVGAWLQRQRLMQDGNDEGYENAANIILWVRKHNMEFTYRSLDLALSNTINSGRNPLHWKPAPKPAEPKDTRSEYSKLAEEAEYKRRAESVIAYAASGHPLRVKTDGIQQIVINGPDGKPDWKATAVKRENEARNYKSRVLGLAR